MNTESQINITDNAVLHIKEIRSHKGDNELFFRITVESGGCSGYQYIFEFDNELFDDDLIFEKDGVKVVTDPVSIDLLEGAEIDYKKDLMGARFQVENPVADSACGCGTSFSVKISEPPV